MVKEGESGEVPVAHVLGDIDFCTVPFTLLKTDPGWGLCQSRGFSSAGRNQTSLEGEPNPLK